MTRWKSYLLPLAAVAVALVARLSLDLYLGNLQPYVTFVLAVAVVAWYEGLGPTLVAIVAGACVSDYFFLPPRHHFAISGIGNLVGFGTYFMVTISIAFIADRQKRSAVALVKAQERLLLQEELRKKDEQFRALADAIPQLCWIANADGWISWYNQRWYEYTGTKPQQMEGWGWQSVHDPAVLPKVMECWKTSIATSEPFEMLFPLRSAHGEFRAFLTRGSPVKDASGKVLRWFGTNTDVDKQKQTEEALRDSQERMAAVMENLTEGLIIAEAKGPVLYWNSAALAMFGYASMEECRRKLADFTDTFEVRPLDDDHLLPVADWAMSRVLRGEVLRDWEVRIRRRDQGWEKILAHSGWLIHSAHGEELAFVSTSDITERKRVQEILRSSEERLQLAVRVASMGIWELQFSTRTLIWAPEVRDIFGVPANAPPPSFEDAIRFTHPEDRSLVEEHMVLLLVGKSIQLDHRIIRPDGKVRWIEVTGKAEFDDTGQPVRCLGFIRDVTERHQLEEQFVQAQKMEAVGRLSGGVAHDFNNMLMVITGYGDLLKEQLGSDERLRPMIEAILKAANRAASLTQQLLAFSRKQILIPRVVDLNSVLADMGKMLPRLIGEDIDLKIVPGNGLGRVMADASQIQQVVMNLVVNARDAMPDGGRLTIETENAEWDEEPGQEYGIETKPGSFVLLSVADNGTGMDRETRAHLFEPFFTTKGMDKGTGLGLSIVYGVVKQSGGFISVDSEPGQGTTFKIYLPGIEAEETNTSPTKVPPKSRRGSETILLVEDEQSVREAISHFLRGQGYTVLEAHNPSVAIEIAREQSKQIHLLMTDMIMPKLNGRELAKQLTATRHEMRVLYISGYTDRGIGGGTIDSTMNFLQKPFGFDALGRKVRDILTS